MLPDRPFATLIAVENSSLTSAGRVQVQNANNLEGCATLRFANQYCIARIGV